MRRELRTRIVDFTKKSLACVHTPHSSDRLRDGEQSICAQAKKSQKSQENTRKIKKSQKSQGNFKSHKIPYGNQKKHYIPLRSLVDGKSRLISI